MSLSKGHDIAYDIYPLLNNSHAANKEQRIDMAASIINTAIDKYKAITIMVHLFSNGEPVQIGSLTFRKGVNDSSFIDALNILIQKI